MIKYEIKITAEDGSEIIEDITEVMTDNETIEYFAYNQAGKLAIIERDNFWEEKGFEIGAKWFRDSLMKAK